MKSRISLFVAFAAMVALGTGGAVSTALGASTQGIVKYGVSLSPKSFSAADLADFFTKAKQAGSILSWAGDWIELENPTGAPAYTVQSAAANGLTPVILLQFFNQSDGSLLRPLDEANKTRYRNSVVAFASQYHPPYIGLGVEVNVLWEKNPADFETFVAFFDELVPAIKAVSPSTSVFSTYELERMKGLKGGLFGGVNDPANNDWVVLSRFPKSDLYAFSAYPGLVYKKPADIPSNYFTEILSHVNKPIAFTESGWHTEASPPGWEGSNFKQQAFVLTLTKLSRGVAAKFTIWSFLYDQNTVEPFRSMGFFSRTGVEKPAWKTWKTWIKF